MRTKLETLGHLGPWHNSSRSVSQSSTTPTCPRPHVQPFPALNPIPIMPTIAAQCRRAVTLALMGVVVLELTGCTVIPRQSGLASTSANVSASNDQIRTQVYGNALGFAGAIRTAANKIIAETDDPVIRRRALKFKMETISVSQIVVSYHDPLVSILDLWAFTVQLTNYYRDGPGRDDFGPWQDDLVATLEKFPPVLRSRALRLVVDTTRVDADNIINQWAVANPIAGEIRQRPWMADTLSTLYQAQGMGALGAMGVIAERISNLSDRVAIYYALMPDQLRWEGEVFLEDILTRNEGLRLALDSVSAISASLGRRVEIAETGSPLIDSLLATVRMDARLLIAEVLDSVDVIRLATMADVDREIAVVLAAVQSERMAVMATLDTLTRARIDQSVSAARGLMWIGIVLGIVILAAPFILGLIVGRAVSSRATMSV